METAAARAMAFCMELKFIGDLLVRFYCQLLTPFDGQQSSKLCALELVRRKEIEPGDSDHIDVSLCLRLHPELAFVAEVEPEVACRIGVLELRSEAKRSIEDASDQRRDAAA